MRKLAFALAAAAALGVVVPASAQGLYAGVGDDGFAIGVADYYSPYYYGGRGETYGDGYRGSPHYYSPGYAYDYSPRYGYGYSYSPGYGYGYSYSPGYAYDYSPGYGYGHSPGYGYGYSYYPNGW